MGRRILFSMILILVGAAAILVFYNFYWRIFSKEVTGLVRVRRVTETTSIFTSNPREIPTSQLYSFAISIRDLKGEEHTSSSEDRQWAVVEDGKCVMARFHPYPPWDLQKFGTYYDARLLRMFDCPEEYRSSVKMAPQEPQPSPDSPPQDSTKTK